MKKLVLLSLLLLTGCAVRRPYQALYCIQMRPDGKSCETWASPKPGVLPPSGRLSGNGEQ